MSNAVNWFEIPVVDMSRAKKFYAAVLGKEMMDLPSENGAMCAFKWTEGGANAAGALVQSEGYEPNANGTTVYFTCDDLDNELGRVEENGGQVMFPKMSIGEFGFIAHIMDTEGNRVALHSAQ